MASLTSRIPDLRTTGPILEVSFGISALLEEKLKNDSNPVPSPVTIIALIDTGASGTVIRKGIPGQLGLNPVGVIPINTPSSTNVDCDVYEARLVLPNNVVFAGSFIEAPLEGQGIDCLIGRDLLSRSVFVYIGYDNSFTLSM